MGPKFDSESEQAVISAAKRVSKLIGSVCFIRKQIWSSNLFFQEAESAKKISAMMTLDIQFPDTAVVSRFYANPNIFIKTLLKTENI